MNNNNNNNNKGCAHTHMHKGGGGLNTGFMFFAIYTKNEDKIKSKRHIIH